jgi:hypothetical protein
MHQQGNRGNHDQQIAHGRDKDLKRASGEIDPGADFPENPHPLPKGIDDADYAKASEHDS